jgi:hypothetical protein
MHVRAETNLEQRNWRNAPKLLRNTDNSDNADNSENTMRQKTSEDYLKEVRAWYLEHRFELHAGVMAEPSGASLRDLSLTLLRSGLTAADEEVFKLFFKPDGNDDLGRVVTRADAEKFRPIVNFLKGTSQTTDVRNLNLIAVLINFPQRPLSKFRKNSESNSRLNFKSGQEVTLDEEGQNTGKDKTVFYWVIGLSLVAAFITILIVTNRPAESCMVWQEDHYTKISCLDTTFQRKLVDPIDLKQFHLRKMQVSKSTPFFVNGEPQVWYVRHNNDYYFFNGPGHHPIFKDKDLRPVSTYIAMKVTAGEIKGK